MSNRVPPALPLTMPSAKVRTFVDQAADAVITAAAEGKLLPGDRLVEADIGRRLGFSRVPVREALRLLESQGLVVSEPYKGMRLMDVTNDAALAITRVRIALEVLAVQECISHGTDAQREAVMAAARLYQESARRAEPSAIRAEDLAFHAALVEGAGRSPLQAAWTAISRQVVVLWGLVPDRQQAGLFADEHMRIADAILRRDVVAAEAALLVHLNGIAHYDFEASLIAKRAARLNP